MFSNDETVDKILRGKISIIQLKKGYRYGFDAVFLAAFVNGYLKKFKKKNFSLVDVGSGVGTISLIIAYKNNRFLDYGLDLLKKIPTFISMTILQLFLITVLF